jgi:hypothetical protein
MVKTLTTVLFTISLIISGFLLERATTTQIKNEVLQRTLTNTNQELLSLSKEVLQVSDENLKLKSTVTNYERTLKSRKLYEDVIVDVAKIRCSSNLRNLDDDIFFLMLGECTKYDIPLDIYFRLVDMESGFKFVVNKQSGANGYMQVMPTTFSYMAKKMGIKGPHNEINNVLVGSYLLKKNYDSWQRRGFTETKSWRLALAAYNAGEGKLQIKEGGKVVGWREPTYTYSYVNYIMKHRPA